MARSCAVAIDTKFGKRGKAAAAEEDTRRLRLQRQEEGRKSALRRFRARSKTFFVHCPRGGGIRSGIPPYALLKRDRRDEPGDNEGS
jgi:hypothetical protein